MNNGDRKKTKRKVCTTSSTGKKRVKGFDKQIEGVTRFSMCLSTTLFHWKKMKDAFFSLNWNF